MPCCFTTRPRPRQGSSSETEQPDPSPDPAPLDSTNAVQVRHQLAEILLVHVKLRYTEEWKERIGEFALFHKVSCSVDKWRTRVLPMIKTQPHLLNQEYCGRTLFCWIVQCSVPQDILLEILAYANEEVVDTVSSDDEQCILHNLAALGHTEALECALSISSRNINLSCKYGDTPLYMLLRSNHEFSVHLNTLKVLLEFGADRNVKNKDGLKPVEVYMWNRCWKYDYRIVQQQKKMFLKILDESDGQKDLNEHKQKEDRRSRCCFCNSFKIFFKNTVNIIRRRGRRRIRHESKVAPELAWPSMSYDLIEFDVV